MEVKAAFVMVHDLLDDGNAKRVEAAMLEALQKAQAEGIEDPLELRRLVLLARDAACS